MGYSPELIQTLQEKARVMRIRSLKMIHAAKSGHPGGSLSAAELISCLFFHELKHDPKRPDDPDRDRFILSKGHGCPILYSAFLETGYLREDEALTLRQLGSRLQGHPDRRFMPWLEASTGSLGQGLSIGIGLALGNKLDKRSARSYVILGDGECDEGQVWEAAMFAGFHKVSNLLCIVDYNKIQLDDRVEVIMNLDPLTDKWKAFGWNVLRIDGHNVTAILDALAAAKKETTKPTVIVADTVKGKGVSFMENQVKFHGVAPTDEELKKALVELGA
ncbi:MAG: transketolase [Planctomycetota bacterium]